LSENKIDMKAELVGLYMITRKRIEKLRESEEKEGKVKPELRLEITLAMKLLDMIKAVPEQQPEEIKLTWEMPKKTE
jgi:hypothetical protein